MPFYYRLSTRRPLEFSTEAQTRQPLFRGTVAFERGTVTHGAIWHQMGHQWQVSLLNLTFFILLQYHQFSDQLSLSKSNYLKGSPLEFKPYKHTANDVALDVKFDLTVPFKT